jgi:hypothetical protein
MRHCLVIPTYNSGSLLEPTLQAVRKAGLDIFVVVDGSDDGSDAGLAALALEDSSLKILRLPTNQGKGAAVLRGFKEALRLGFTHALVFDSDGQHDAKDIPKVLALSQKNPTSMVLGIPVFGPDAPAVRVYGRRLGNWWTHFETLWGGIGDSLFGFRVYPVNKAVEVLDGIRAGRRFDFETQLAVRLYWRGVPAVCFSSAVKYVAKADGGVSHFKYLRDNLLLIWTHLALSFHAVCILPRLLRLRRENLRHRA